MGHTIRICIALLIVAYNIEEIKSHPDFLNFSFKEMVSSFVNCNTNKICSFSNRVKKRHKVKLEYSSKFIFILLFVVY
jgi:hypothetical protein